MLFWRCDRRDSQPAAVGATGQALAGALSQTVMHTLTARIYNTLGTLFMGIGSRYDAARTHFEQA